MTLSKADRAAIERLTDALNALTAAIKEGTKQLKASRRFEMQSIKLLTECLGVKPKKQPARTKAP
jgi:hypothetical protein